MHATKHAAFRRGRFGPVRRGLLLGLALALAGCGGPGPAPAPEARPPARRVVTYSPALAKLLFQMGLGDRIVGVTDWTRLPAGETRPVVGDSAGVDSERLLSVRPDLVLAQRTDLAPFAGLRRADPSIGVELFEIETVPDLRAAIPRIGALLGAPAAAADALRRFDERLDAMRSAAAGRSAPRVLFLMGAERPYGAGPDNFIHDLILCCGGINAGAELPGPKRWRATDVESVLRVRPDVLICQVPTPEAEAAARVYWQQWPDLPAAAAGRIHAVSDPDWTIPSLRLAGLLPALFEMIHGCAPTAPGGE